MKKITFLLCAALLLTGCGIQPSQPEVSETETEATKSVIPDGVNIVYAAETTDYRHITYAYPVFADNDAVNASVKSYTEKLICEQIEGAWSPEEAIPEAVIQFDLPECPAQDEDTMLSIDMDVTVTRKDEQYISLFYEGIFNVKGTAHPTHIAEGLILDAETGEVLHLSELYKVDKAFVRIICEALTEQGSEYFAENFGMDADDQYTHTMDWVADKLAYYDEPYTTTTVYLTADGLGFSFPVSHAVGDHAEIVIPYEELETFRKADAPDEVPTEQDTDISADVNADDFLGLWECGDHMMLTVAEAENGYFAYLICSESTQVYEEWEYPLHYESGRLICDGDGIRYAVDETKWDTQMIQERHPDQSAEFSMTADGILWNDRTEHRGDGMVFTFVQDGLI